jgi:membrane dipeptidase
MLIVDAHLDLAWNALQYNRDLLQNVYTLRVQEKNMVGGGRGQNTVSFPELRRGRVALCFGTVLARVNFMGSPEIDYGSPAQAFAAARGHLLYYHALAQQGHIRLITNRAELEAHMQAWEIFDALSPTVTSDTPPTGVIISMECADPILSPLQVQEWYDLGLRAVGPAHYGYNRYVGGTGTERGFNDAGLELLRVMEHAGMMLDVTHLSDEAFWEAMGFYEGTILASHHNCRALVPHQRQLSDEQIRALVARDAVIGAAFDMWMLIPDWSYGKSSNRDVTIATVAEHIDHVCQLAGDSLHSAIGSDLDGGFGRESSPSDLDTIADVQHLCEALAARDYGDDDIANVMYRNWLRLIRRAWPEE